MKVQKSQKKKNKEPEFVGWSKAKYPQQKGNQDQKASNEDWGDFHSSDFPSNQGENAQIGSEAFATFGQFSGDETNQKNTSVWEGFEFGNTEGKNTQEDNKKDWNPNLWETPQFNADYDNKGRSDFETFGFTENKEEGKEEKTDGGNFDFFGDFATAGTSNTEKKDDTENNLI